MKSGYAEVANYVKFLLILIAVSPSKCMCWGFFSFSSKEYESHDSTNKASYNSPMVSVAKFAIDGLNDPKSLSRVENAKNKLANSNSCWQNSYRHLFSACSEIIATEEKRARLAWHLSDCFQKDSGRQGFPYCDSKSAMIHCLKKLSDDQNKVYLEFLLETNSICHQLQAHAFKQDTERLVNELKNTAQFTEEKLNRMEEKSDYLLQSSNQIHDSLSSVNLNIEKVAQETKNVEDHVNVLSKHSEEIYSKSIEIANSQSSLQENQLRMSDRFKEGMEMLHESYSNLGQEVDNLKTETIEIEKEIGKVGEAMSSRMNVLQEKANDIGDMAGISLDKQKQLLDGQSTAMKGLQSLTRSQSEALEESRNTLQQLAEYGRKQQEELAERQAQLQRVHDHLIENSKSILIAQEAFESKQAGMFLALDRLFALHNAMVLESRIIKAFIMYSASIFIIYMFTSTKQTYTVRPWLYIGLCATFIIEVGILRASMDIDKQTWIINFVRSAYAVLALIQFLFSIFTYRDYEVLNHNLLRSLMEKVNGMERKNELMYNDDDDDIQNWKKWVDTDLPEEEEEEADPDYSIAPQYQIANAKSALTNTFYCLRNRGKGC